MSQVEILASIVYYAFFLFGSISAGYLILRLTRPNIRVDSREQKLGYSALLGIFLVIVAAGIDFLINQQAFFSATGFFPPILFGCSVAGFFVLKTHSVLFKSQFVEVGVPAPPQPIRYDNLVSSMDEEEKIPEVVVHEGLKKPVIVSSKERAEEVRKQLSEEQDRISAESGDVELSHDVEAEKMELRKAHEAELNNIVTDVVSQAPRILIPSAPPEGPARYRQYLRKPAPPVEEGKEVQQPAEYGKGAQQPAEEQKEGQQPVAQIPVKTVASQEEDFGLMVQDVYTQLKSQKSSYNLKDQMTVQEPPKPEPFASRKAGLREKPQQQEQTLSMQDLFGPSASEKQEEKPVEENQLFAQLNKIGSPEAKKESDVAFVKMPSEQGMGCPRCHSQNSRIVFCPYCGSAMCANCTPLIKPVEGGFEYSCPKCGETVQVKKRSA